MTAVEDAIERCCCLVVSLLQILDAGVRGVGHVEAVDRLTLAKVHLFGWWREANAVGGCAGHATLMLWDFAPGATRELRAWLLLLLLPCHQWARIIVATERSVLSLFVVSCWWGIQLLLGALEWPIYRSTLRFRSRVRDSLLSFPWFLSWADWFSRSLGGSFWMPTYGRIMRVLWNRMVTLFWAYDRPSNILRISWWFILQDPGQWLFILFALLLASLQLEDLAPFSAFRCLLQTWAGVKTGRYTIIEGFRTVRSFRWTNYVSLLLDFAILELQRSWIHC